MRSSLAVSAASGAKLIVAKRPVKKVKPMAMETVGRTNRFAAMEIKEIWPKKNSSSGEQVSAEAAEDIKVLAMNPGFLDLP